jgi:hypothetical protein
VIIDLVSETNKCVARATLAAKQQKTIRRTIATTLLHHTIKASDS